MKRLLAASALALGAGFALAVAPAPAMTLPPAGVNGPTSLVVPVANWRNPHSNVDRRVDNGGDTGDSLVPGLNEAQLDRNYRGPWYYRDGSPAPAPGATGTMPSGSATMMPPVAAPPTAYSPPPVVVTPGAAAPLR